MALRLRGRDAPLGTLTGQLDALAAGRGGVILVAGLPGMGKTALLAVAAELARDRGIRVLHGSADPAALAIPLRPLLEALVPANDPLVDAEVARDLSRCPDQRFWLLREVQESLERAAGRSPVLICIDDVQWADPATLSALSTLPVDLASHCIAWLLAIRCGELPATTRTALDRLEGIDPVRVTLGPLGPEAVADIADDLLGATPDAALRQALDGVGGHPLLVTELLRGLLEENLVKVADGTAQLIEGQLPGRFMDSADRYLTRLSGGARDALRMASLLGRRFSADELAALLGVEPPAIFAALREALASGLVVDDGDRLAFGHDLVREAIDASLPRAVRRSLRRRALDVMLRHGAAPADVAELVMEVARPGDGEAIGLLRQAAASVAQASPAAAARLSERALDLATAEETLRGILVTETIGYLVRAGHAAHAMRLISATAGDLTGPCAEAEARLSLAILSLQYSAAGTASQCRQALARPGVPAALRIRLLSVLSLGLNLAGEAAAAEAPAAEATALAQASGDPASELVTLLPRAVRQFALGDWCQAVDLISAAAARQHQPDGAALRQVMPDAWLALIFIALARLDDAFALIDTGTLCARREGLSANTRIWSLLRCRALFSAGLLADAAAEAEAAIEMADKTGDGDQGYVSYIALYFLGLVAVHTGDPAAIARARRSVAVLRGARSWGPAERLGSWLSALIADGEGAPVTLAELSAAALDPLASGPLTAGSPWMYPDLPTMTRMLAGAGRRTEAECVVRRLARLADSLPDFPFLEAARLHATAILEGDADAALRAVALGSPDPRPLVRAAMLEDAARLLPADRAAEAVPLAEEARAAYEASGAERDVARVRSQLRALGVRQPAVPRPPSPWPELTEAEVAVVNLAARGATNREVAARLCLSPHTVHSHLRHVFVKLGIRSRVELARLAAERDAGA
jgi:DNA-binding CsgD family transcriptional regulator